MYTKCEEAIKRIGFREVKTGKLVTIDLGFFGIESLVDETELMKLSESEQRRHKREDLALATVYADYEPKRKNTIALEIVNF
ncbi:MAG: hypothetical protein RBU23_12770 [Candidatus Auribacterota bacterium]|nr:hypothetical protein [Candidatus Auribacterota bacterium]